MAKKVTLITQYFRPEMGAPQSRLYELAVGLQKVGFDVSIITGMPNYPIGHIFSEYKGKFFCREILDGLVVLRYWLFASNSKKKIPRIVNMLSFSTIVFCSLFYLLKRRSDLIIVESPPLILGISGWLLARFTKAKFIFNVSDLWPLSAKELGALSEGFVYNVLAKIEHFLYRKADLCMGQSEEIVQYIESHGAGKVYLFRNGVDPDRFRLLQEDPKEANTLVYAGLLGVAQGILNICRQVDFIKCKVTFHIFGEGAEKEEILKFLTNNPKKNIVYHGSVSREQIPMVLKHYSASLIVLVKNIFGAVPSKIYESMAAGLPILFSGEGEAARIIQKYDLGWTSKAQDYYSLEDNIMKAFADKRGFDKKKNNCIEVAEEVFNRKRQIEKLADYLMKM